MRNEKTAVRWYGGLLYYLWKKYVGHAIID